MINFLSNKSTTKLLSKDKPVLSKNENDSFETVLFLPCTPDRKGEGGIRTKGYFKHSYKLIDGKWWMISDDSSVKEVELSEEVLEYLMKEGYKELPLISIITVVFNGEKYLERTIQSVINQTYPNVEYIIIDGGSTDGTLDIIKRYEEAIDYWVSEKDKGIYDAMNKGIICSTGKIIGIINSDDFYIENIFGLIVDAFSESINVDIVHSDLLFIDETNKMYKIIGNRFHNINYLNINHLTCFIKRELYKKKLFDTQYKISADYDLILTFYLIGKSFKYIPEVVGTMRSGGISSNTIGVLIDTFKIKLKHFGFFNATITILRLGTMEILKKILIALLKPLKMEKKIKYKAGWRDLA